MSEKLTGAGGIAVKPQRIDLDALHRYLFRRADRMGRLKINVKKLAVELELSYCNLTVVIIKMAETDRMRRIGGAINGSKTYVIVDPTTWRDS